MNPEDAFSSIPEGLRKPLLEEYESILTNYSEHRWSPSELSGGRLCEIVYTILDGYASGTYASAPSKPNDFVSACRRLEQNSHVPRSFQILIPRLLPALYEVRNNRGVGHVGGDVDPNHMDATFVLNSASWTMGELVRVLHSLPVSEAQSLVDKLVEIRMPLVWSEGDIRRVLNPLLSQKQQILVLLASVSGKTPVRNLESWIEVKNKGYFLKTLRSMHTARLLEFNETDGHIQLLPPGSKEALSVVKKSRVNIRSRVRFRALLAPQEIFPKARSGLKRVTGWSPNLLIQGVGGFEPPTPRILN